MVRRCFDVRRFPHCTTAKKLTSSNPLKLFIICMWPPMFPSPLVKFYEPLQRVLIIKGWTEEDIALLLLIHLASAGAAIFTQLPATPFHGWRIRFKHGPVSQAQAHGQINPCHTSLRKKKHVYIITKETRQPLSLRNIIHNFIFFASLTMTTGKHIISISIVAHVGSKETHETSR